MQRERAFIMPAASEANPLQRSLADAIIRMLPLDEIRILLACGAKVNEPVTQGLRALHYAVWQRYEEAVGLLLVRGADINALDDCGYSALHLAAEHGYVELARILLKAGSKVDFREPTDEMFPRTTLCDEPLRLALRNHHYELAQLLLEYGADANKRYFFGAEINLVNDVEALALLLTFGANPNFKDRSGLTPLMKAARYGQGIEKVLLLLNHGADINIMSDSRNDFRTVLHYAVLSGNMTMVNLLLKQGAKVDVMPPYPEPDRSSPLDLAILRCDPVLVRMLLEAGADVNRCSPVIGSPLHVACADNISHRVEIIKMLLSYGADPNIRVYTDTESILRPPIAELLASNETVTMEELHLLLRYGAKVIMKTQFREPEGLLNCLTSVPADSQLFNTLLEVSEEFDPCLIKRNVTLSPAQREKLLEKAGVPRTLKAQSRTFFRRLFGKHLPLNVPDLEIPVTLKSYLLYEHN